MSKKKKSGKKKVVVTPKNQQGKRVITGKNTEPTKKQKLVPTTSKRKTGVATTKAKFASDFIFDRKNYMLMLGGIGLMTIGFLLMLGGNMPSPEVWEPERIYSFRRVTLAPMFIIAGLGLEVFAIFKKF